MIGKRTDSGHFRRKSGFVIPLYDSSFISKTHKSIYSLKNVLNWIFCQYGTRHIVGSMRDHGAPVSCLLLCGGLTKSELFVSTMADVLGIPVVIPEENESVLLGSAMLGACASGSFTSLPETMAAMGGNGTHITPNLQEKE